MKLGTLALSLLATCGLAARGEAQVVHVGLSHGFRHGGISLGLRFGPERTECRPAYRVWVPGHYEVREQRVWVPGECRRIWVDPVYAWRADYRGFRQRVLVRAGYWRTVREPGRYETRRVQVWVEGCWTSP